MKITLQAWQLNDAMAMIGPVAPMRTPKPVLSCVKIVAAEGTAVLTATDLESGVRYSIADVQVDEPGEIAIPAKRLADIAKSMAGEVVISTTGTTANISGDGSRFKVFGFDAAECPLVQPPAEGREVGISGATLAAVIGRTAFATARTSGHYAISGLLFEVSAKRLRVVATDGHRLAICDTDAKADGDAVAVVSPKFCAMVAKLGDGDVSLRISETAISATTAKVTITGQLVAGNFPKYADIIPKGATSTAILDGGAAAHAVRMAAMMAGGRGIRCTFEGETLTITSATPEMGEATARCGVKLNGDKIAIGFNPAFIADGLQACGDGEVVLSMTAPNKPAVMRAERFSFAYIIMPVEIA